MMTSHHRSKAVQANILQIQTSFDQATAEFEAHLSSYMNTTATLAAALNQATSKIAKLEPKRTKFFYDFENLIVGGSRVVLGEDKYVHFDNVGCGLSGTACAGNSGLLGIAGWTPSLPSHPSPPLSTNLRVHARLHDSPMHK